MGTFPSNHFTGSGAPTGAPAPRPGSRFNRSLAGKRVRLIATNDQWTDLRRGATGTIKYHNDVHGSLSVLWDNGSSLSLLDGIDLWEVID